MSTFTRSLGSVALALAGFGLTAGEDFAGLTQVAKATWPAKNHVGVICDYRFSQDQVDLLASALGPGSRITVVDLRSADQTALASHMLANRHADYLVLMPNDRVVRDGSIGGTMAVTRLARLGIPAVGTSPVALRQGAVFSLGEGTNGELLVTNQLKGTVDVILPEGIRFTQKAAMPLFQGKAEITVATPE